MSIRPSFGLLATYRVVGLGDEPSETSVTGNSVQALHQPLLHHVMHVVCHFRSTAFANRIIWPRSCAQTESRYKINEDKCWSRELTPLSK